jgi:hypothetical protein
MQCVTCNSEMKLIPAGVSKATGRPYTAFYSCPNRCPKPTTYSKPQTNGIGEAMEKKNVYIKEAQDRKDLGMTILNSKNAGASITVALIEKGFIQPEQVEATFRKYADFVYNYKPSETEDFGADEIPFD